MLRVVGGIICIKMLYFYAGAIAHFDIRIRANIAKVKSGMLAVNWF
ncbi:hypothetical protein LC593_09095 [Nostoc sp. CHAB 5844]|nr:hypothetical protein [Nostoc sp. CHAB 5844]